MNFMPGSHFKESLVWGAVKEGSLCTGENSCPLYPEVTFVIASGRFDMLCGKNVESDPTKAKAAEQIQSQC